MISPTPNSTDRPAASRVISFDAVSYVIGGRVILNNFDLEIRGNEKVALLGASGAGKSTLLNMVIGWVKPTAGQVTVIGMQPSLLGKNQLRKLRANIGFVSQEHGLVAEVSAFENILHGALAGLRLPRLGPETYPRAVQERAIALAEKYGIQELLGQPVSQLSGGEKQRVSICRALMNEPELVIADEPISSLDIGTARLVLRDLSKVAESGIPVICALHQVDLALGWADRIVVLSGGKLMIDSPASKLDSATLERAIR